MKVNIGPYPTWWGPFQILGLFNKTGIGKGITEKAADKLPDWMFNLCQWIYSKRKRKIVVKLKEYDTWDMCDTLGLIVLPMLRQVKSQKKGVSYGVLLELGGNIDKSYNEWGRIMDRMIWSFERMQDEDFELFFLDNGLTNQDAYLAYQGRIQEGLELFGKYYRELWS